MGHSPGEARPTMSARSSRFSGFRSRRRRGKAAGAVIACAALLLAGCGGSGGSAADAGAPVIRGDASGAAGAADATLSVSNTTLTGTVLKPITLTYVGGSSTGTVAFASSANCTVTGTSLAPIATATAPVTCTVTATQGTKTSAAVTFTFAAVAAAATSPLTVSGSAATAEVRSTITLTSAGGSVTSAVTYVTTSTGCAVTEASLTATVAGTCTVTATQGTQTGTASFTFTAPAADAAPTSVSTVAGVPGKPAAPTVAAGVKMITVTVAEVAPGATPTGYNLVAYQGRSSAGSCSVKSVMESCKVTGLNNGTQYKVQAEAWNAIGTSQRSEWSAAVMPGTAPRAPRLQGAIAAGPTTVKVSFLAPDNGYSAITSYTAISDPPGGTGTVYQSGDGDVLVTGLTTGIAYTFKMTATNGIGTSGESGSSASVTTVAAPAIPGTPTGVAGAGKVIVTVTAGSGGGTPSSFTVMAAPAVSGTTMTCRTPVGSNSCPVTGLANNTAYRFTATATNTGGTSTASAPSSPVTTATVPSAPTVGTVTMKGTTATIPFTAPSNGGSPITGYTATSFTTTANQAAVTASVAGTATSIIVTGLTGGVTYGFKVTATNLAGTSALATAPNQVKADVAPGMPVITAVTISGTTATVTYTAPTANGGTTILNYKAVSTPGGKSGTVNRSGSGTVAVAGLTPGSSYQFTVSATNSGYTTASVLSSSPVTAPPVAPAQMAQPILDFLSSGVATIRFTAPTNTGGSPLTLFTVYAAGKTASFAAETGKTYYTVTISGYSCTPGQIQATYAQVVATNAAGKSSTASVKSYSGGSTCGR